MRVPVVALLPLLVACRDPSPKHGASDDSGETGSEAPLVSEFSVAVHPEVATILVATWSQAHDAERGRVEYRFEGDDWLSSPSRAIEAGPASETLLGLPADTDVEIRLVQEIEGVSHELDEGWHAHTGPLPESLPLPVLNLHDPALASASPFLLTTVDSGAQPYSGPYWVLILDRKARPVWYHLVEGQRLSIMSRPAADATHVTWAEVDYFGEVPSSIERATLDGAWSQSVEVPEIGYTYDELPDGSLAYDYWLTGETGIAVLSPEGENRHLWNCVDWLPRGHRFWDCGTNTVRWDETRRSYFWSLYELATILEVDGDSGALVGGWGDLGPDPLLPADAGFQMQHYPGWTASGTLLVHTQEVGDARVQWAREYAYEASTRTLTQIWSYAATDRYAACSGEAVRLENGNTLLNYGCGRGVREITSEGLVVWDLVMGGLVGHQELIDDLYALNRGR
jgi:hypothetical protein